LKNGLGYDEPIPNHTGGEPMEEESLRRMAIQQYLQERSPVSIYQELGRSKKWFFKWLQRYQSGHPEWYRDHSKAPHSRPHQTPIETQTLVKNTRLQLEANPYAQVGVSAIKWQCQGLGVTLPSDRTINRILKKEGLIKKNTVYPQGSALPYFQGPFRVQQYLGLGDVPEIMTYLRIDLLIPYPL